MSTAKSKILEIYVFSVYNTVNNTISLLYSEVKSLENNLGFIHNENGSKGFDSVYLTPSDRTSTRGELTDITLLCDNAIGYFEFTECLADLLRTGHISAEDDAYSVTEKGT